MTDNAVATQSSSSSSSSREERDSIIIGDGVFTFLEWLDLSANGPSHHLQYNMGEQSRNSNNGGGGMSKAEQTRRFELMADVFGSYYAAHKHGRGTTPSNCTVYSVRRLVTMGQIWHCHPGAIYGDDELSPSPSLNDDGLIGDFTQSYLESELSWFVVDHCLKSLKQTNLLLLHQVTPMKQHRQQRLVKKPMNDITLRIHWWLMTGSVRQQD